MGSSKAATGRLGLTGIGGAVLGRLVFIAAEIQALAQGDDETPLLPIAAMVTSVSMILVGIVVLRSGHWAGWHRLVPLGIGVYPLLFMIPFAATSPEPPMFAIAGRGASLGRCSVSRCGRKPTRQTSRRSDGPRVV